MKRRFEIDGHILGQYSLRWFVREGTFTADEMKLLREVRREVRRFVPKFQLYKLIVEENDLGFMVITIETNTRKYVFSQPTLAEALQDMKIQKPS